MSKIQPESQGGNTPASGRKKRTRYLRRTLHTVQRKNGNGTSKNYSEKATSTVLYLCISKETKKKHKTKEKKRVQTVSCWVTVCWVTVGAHAT